MLRPGGALPALRGDGAGLEAPQHPAQRMGHERHSDAVVQPVPRPGARPRGAERRRRRSRQISDFASSYYVATRLLKPLLAAGAEADDRRRRSRRRVQPLGGDAAACRRLRHAEALRPATPLVTSPPTSSCTAYAGRSITRTCTRARYSPMIPSVSSCAPEKIAISDAGKGSPARGCPGRRSAR